MLGCLSVTYLLSAPGSAVGPLVASHPLPLSRALAPWPYRRPRALRGGLARQCGAHGLVGSRGCTSTPTATCLRNPLFHGRRTAAHWWLRRGTTTCALVLVVWFMGWIRAMRRPMQAGCGAAQTATAVVGLAHPPSAPLFDGQKVAQKSRAGPVFGLYMHLKPPPAPLLVTPVCREQQFVATCRTGPDMALHRRVFSK